MSQSFDLSGVTHVQLNGVDCPKLMLNGVRIWERYTATRQVWVSSGYNSSSWVSRGSGGSAATHIRKVGNQVIWEIYYWGFNLYVITYGTEYITGSWKFVRGVLYRRAPNGKEYYRVNAYESVTSWVDTSAYQTENYTAYYY